MIQLMYEPMDEEDRNFDNLYKIITDASIDELTDSNKFANFFAEFATFVEETIKIQKNM
jgi:CRISPR/Cas system CSM-associated protein Csm2 small subunit